MRRYKLRIWGISLFVLNIATIAALGLFYSQQPKFVVFDVKGVTDTFLKQVVELNVSEEQGKKLVVRYERILKGIIEDYTEKNTVVLVKNAVVSDLEDKTAEIKQKIAQQMRSPE